MNADVELRIREMIREELARAERMRSAQFTAGDYFRVGFLAAIGGGGFAFVLVTIARMLSHFVEWAWR